MFHIGVLMNFGICAHGLKSQHSGTLLGSSVATHYGLHLLLSLFICPSTQTIEIGVIWYFIVVLAYIFLVTNYTDHLFMCLFVSHISYLMRYLFKPFVCAC